MVEYVEREAVFLVGGECRCFCCCAEGYNVVGFAVDQIIKVGVKCLKVDISVFEKWRGECNSHAAQVLR